MTRVGRVAATVASAVAVQLVAGLLPATLDAQVLRVTLRDSLSDAPIAAALVAAVDARGVALVERLSGRNGDATLGLPGPATVRIRVRRIGIVPTLTGPLTVREGETLTLALRPPRIEQPLPAVTVIADGCTPGAAPPRAAALWERLRIALQSSALRWSDPAHASLAFERTTRVRELTPDLWPVLSAESWLPSSQGWTRRVAAGRPYTATDTAALRRHGWMHELFGGGRAWYAPDDALLASDWFRDAHCFTVPASDDTPGIAEVRFAPARRRGAVSITGSAFVDTITGDPLSVSFLYVGRTPGDVGIGVDAPHAGGLLGLAKRADGTWYVGRWLIRAPRTDVHGFLRRPVLVGYQEEVGDAIPVDELAQVPDTAGASPLDWIRRRTFRLTLTAVPGNSVTIAPMGPVTVRWRDGEVTRQVVSDCYGRTVFELPVGRTVRLTATHPAFPAVDTLVTTGRVDSTIMLRMYPDPSLPPAFRRWRDIVEPRTLSAVAARRDPARHRRLQAESCALLMRDTVQGP